MTIESRDERLLGERCALVALRRASSIFDFDCTGNPPEAYTLRFQGRGVTLPIRSLHAWDRIGVHALELTLPRSFPVTSPYVRWITPIFHPNVPPSGMVDWPAIGISWQPDLGIDVLCERLWDVARAAYIDVASSCNRVAAEWFRCGRGLAFPVDTRPLRDRDTGERGSCRGKLFGEILLITEDTLTPDLPVGIFSSRAFADASDVLYISD